MLETKFMNLVMEILDFSPTQFRQYFSPRYFYDFTDFTPLQ